MSDIVERLPKMATMLRETPAHVLRGAGNLDVAATMMDEATETIIALRAEVEAAKADAAMARQGYVTAYAEFDKKCRTINRLVCEKSAMKKALEKIAENDADGLHMYTPQAMQAVAVAALSTTEAK